MKYKYLKLRVVWEDVILIGLGFMALIGLFLVVFWASHNAEKKNPMDSTS